MKSFRTLTLVSLMSVATLLMFGCTGLNPDVSPEGTLPDLSLPWESPDGDTGADRVAIGAGQGQTHAARRRAMQVEDAARHHAHAARLEEKVIARPLRPVRVHRARHLAVRRLAVGRA